MVLAYIVVIVWFVLESIFNFIDKGGKGGKKQRVGYSYYCRNGSIWSCYLLRGSFSS